MNEQVAAILKDVLTFQGLISGLAVYLLKKAIDSLIENTKEMIVFRTELRMIKENADKVPKLEKDIQGFHAWKRSVTKEGESERLSR